jgi:dihydroxyacetone kinase-like protein
MSADWARAWLRASAAAVHRQSGWLTDLDAAIGDGDHGINLDRGFGQVVARLDAGDPPAATAAALLAQAGRVILGSVGGASGALYGRAFQRAGASLDPTNEPGTPYRAETSRRPGTADGRSPAQEPALWALVRAFEAATGAIAALGRSGPGDKTMLDALLPAAAALRASAIAGHELRDALRQAVEAAERGLEATRPLVARRGRASYLGERSAGHLDPGAASSLLIVRALAETIADR